jgi:hypothetical protein
LLARLGVIRADSQEMGDDQRDEHPDGEATASVTGPFYGHGRPTVR